MSSGGYATEVVGVEEVARLSRELNEAELRVARARRALYGAILAAYEAELRPSRIAVAAGMSRQSLHRVVRLERERRRQRAAGRRP